MDFFSETPTTPTFRMNTRPINAAANLSKIRQTGANLPSAANPKQVQNAAGYPPLRSAAVELATPRAVPSCMTTWNNAPATDCSFSFANLETSKIPVAKIKSGPKTDIVIAGKASAQYGRLGLKSAKSNAAAAVHDAPTTAPH